MPEAPPIFPTPAKTDEDFKFEYRSASGSRIRHRINRALLSGSDLDLVKVFHVVADNAYEFGRREENEACAVLCDDYDKFFEKAQGEKHFVMFEQLSGKIRARMEDK